MTPHAQFVWHLCAVPHLHCQISCVTATSPAPLNSRRKMRQLRRDLPITTQ